MTENRLSGLIDDDTYHMLERLGFLNEIHVRNYYMKVLYKQLREKKTKSEKCIEIIQGEFPYLAYGSVVGICTKDNTILNLVEEEKRLLIEE